MRRRPVGPKYPLGFSETVRITVGACEGSHDVGVHHLQAASPGTRWPASVVLVEAKSYWWSTCHEGDDVAPHRGRRRPGRPTRGIRYLGMNVTARRILSEKGHIEDSRSRWTRSRHGGASSSAPGRSNRSVMDRSGDGAGDSLENATTTRSDRAGVRRRHGRSGFCVELPLEEVLLQKRAIRRTPPVIVATQMLDFDDRGCGRPERPPMLSGETSVGKFPVAHVASSGAVESRTPSGADTHSPTVVVIPWLRPYRRTTDVPRPGGLSLKAQDTVR